MMQAPESKRAGASTATARSQALREKRAAAGLAEVRGIWASPEHHRSIKAVADALADQLQGAKNISSAPADKTS